MQIARNEAGASALNFVWAWFKRLTSQGLRNDGRIFRLDGDCLKRGFSWFDGLVTTGDCPSGSDRRDENIDLPGGLDHGHSDPIFDAAKRIEKLALEQNGCGRSGSNPVQAHERRATDGFDNIVVNASHRA